MMPWQRKRRDDELDEELAGHLRLAIAERVARGESAADAERAARRELGNLGLVKEVTREMWGGGSIERLWQDLRYGMRTLRRSPAFTMLAVLTLAIGIGATTAMFTVVHAVLLRPLPYPNVDRLMQLSHHSASGMFDAGPEMADVDWIAIRDSLRQFDGLAASAPALVNLTEAGDPARIPGAAVTAEYFSTLGTPPRYGRPFSRADEPATAARVVALGNALWRERFASDPGIVGRAITLDGMRYTVVAVMPAGFAFPDDAQLWLPLELHPSEHWSQLVRVVGRLRNGATREQAEAELTARFTGAEKSASDPQQKFVTQVVPLKNVVVGGAERSLLVFAGAVALVLLIACANVANLLLMRATTRQREMAVRAALGAGRRRLVRQLLTETTFLWLVGAAAGIAVAFAGVRVLVALAPAGRIPRIDEIGVDPIVLAFALGVGLMTGLLFGIVPAIRMSRGSVRDALAATSRTVSSRDGGIRGALVIAEIALALVLLAGAGLMTQSFVRMRNVELGFRPAGVSTMTVDLPGASYPSAAAMQRFHRTMLERLAAIPGVTSAAAVNWLPLGGALMKGDFTLPDGRERPKGFVVSKPAVSPGYFRTMGIPLIAGREFEASDGPGGPGVVVVSRSVADRIWPGGTAVGQRVSMADQPGPDDWVTVVGVVEDVAQSALDGQRDAAIYFPLARSNSPFSIAHMAFVVRTTGDVDALVPAMRQAIHDVDPTQPINGIVSMDAAVGRTVADPLFQARLIGFFSIVALVLAAVGIYGVVAYSVAERTHEIGVRVALGAGRPEVIRLVMRRILVLLVPGIGLGAAGALVATRVLASLLFEVKPNDPVTFIGVAMVLSLVAVVAGFVPARRASRVDPLVTLRAG